MNVRTSTRIHTLSAALALVAVAALSGCRTATMPDLGGLYNRAAQTHDAHRNPVIVIPGILGSKLVEEGSGQIVWGSFGGGAANPRSPEGASVVALPMAEGKTLRELRDDVVPDGVLDKIKVRFAGLPLQLKAYFQILLALGAGGYRDEDFHVAGIDYGSDHFTCFQFDYDWRRDNVENAERLHRFMLEKRDDVRGELEKRYGIADAEVRFDVIAHSMGGLILRYFLRYGSSDLPADGSLPELDWQGAELVDKAVVIAAPNAGALEALTQLVNGRKFAPITPRYEPAIIGTYPSLYQLLPRVRHGALQEGGRPVDFMDPALWETNGWGLLAPDQEPVLEVLLPDVGSAAGRRRIARDHLVKSLERARRFHAALDLPARVPEGTELFLVAGDAVDTPRAASYRGGKMEIVAYGPGDGTVLRSSALMDERVGSEWTPQLLTPIDWRHVTFLFSNHLGMTRDPVFTDNVLYLLLEAPSGPITSRGGPGGG